MKTVFIIEDDEDIREIVLYALRSAGFNGMGFESSEKFFACIYKTLPSLVLLDIMLPGEDGLSILKRLRNNPQTASLPLIMLTAKGSEYDKVKGLDLGADDYITKPFGVMELISRINALLRRTGDTQDVAEVLEYKGIVFDKARHDVAVNGVAITLTHKEYSLLHYLMLNAGLVMRRDKIMETVWGYDFEGESRTLDMHIHTLRQKLGASGEYIKTIRNVGFKFGD